MPSIEPLLPLEDARRLLARHLPWSPLDFIPVISRRGDRALHAETLTADVGPENDLRFRTALSDGTPLGIFARRLAWDSDFFGYGVARLDAIFPLAPPLDRYDADYTPALAHFEEAARQRGIRYLWTAVDPRDLPLQRALGQRGFSLIETRIIQFLEIALLEDIPPPSVRRATPDDLPSLRRVAREAVNRYDRFHSDPFLDQERVARMMELWVEESLAGRMADLVLVPDVPKPEAFVSYRLHRGCWEQWKLPVAQAVIAAATPEFLGWSAQLAVDANYHLLAEGVRWGWCTTQATNRAIIWHTQDAGARYGGCQHVFRKLL